MNAVATNKHLQNLTILLILICGISVFLPWTTVYVKQFTLGSGVSIVNEAGSGFDRDEGIGFIIVLGLAIYFILNRKYNFIVFFGIVYFIYGIGLINDWGKASGFGGTGNGYIRTSVTAKFGIYIFIISSGLFAFTSYLLKRQEKNKISNNDTLTKPGEEGQSIVLEHQSITIQGTENLNKESHFNISPSTSKDEKIISTSTNQTYEVEYADETGYPSSQSNRNKYIIAVLIGIIVVLGIMYLLKNEKNDVAVTSSPHEMTNINPINANEHIEQTNHSVEAAQNQQESEISNKAQEDTELNGEKVYSEVDVKPEYPGGDSVYMKYIDSHFKIENTELVGKPYESFRVVVDLIIDKNGDLKNIKPVSQVGQGVEEEFIRVLKTLPKYIPAKLNGKNVNYHSKNFFVEF